MLEPLIKLFIFFVLIFFQYLKTQKGIANKSTTCIEDNSRKTRKDWHCTSDQEFQEVNYYQINNYQRQNKQVAWTMDIKGRGTWPGTRVGCRRLHFAEVPYYSLAHHPTARCSERWVNCSKKQEAKLGRAGEENIRTFLTSEADTKSSSRSGGSAMASVNVFQNLSFPEAPQVQTSRICQLHWRHPGT